MSLLVSRKSLLVSLVLLFVSVASHAGPTGSGSNLSPDDVILNKGTLQSGKTFDVSGATIATLTSTLVKAQSITIGGQPVSTATVTSGTSVYPATGTASFPFGLVGSTATFTGNVAGTTVTLTGILNGATIHGSSMVITGTITGANLAGTNTGDVTIGTGNGLSIAGQAISAALASSTSTGTLRAFDFSTFSAKLSPTGDGSGLTGLTKTQVGLSNVQNLDQTDASNLATGLVDPVLIGTGTPSSIRYLRGDSFWAILNSTAVGLGNVLNGAQVLRTDYTQKGGFLVGIGTGGVYAVLPPGADGTVLASNSASPYGISYVIAPNSYTVYPATATAYFPKGEVVSTLTVTGAAVFQGTNTYSNAQIFNGYENHDGTATFSNSVLFTGTNTFNGPATINGDQVFNGTNTFNGGIVTNGYDQHFGTGTYVGNPLYFANTEGPGAGIPGARFTTDLGNVRYASIEGEEEADAAQIGLDFYTMNGDIAGIVKKLRIHPEGYLEQYLSGVTNVWNGNQYNAGWETHVGTGTFEGDQIFNGTNTYTGGETHQGAVTNDAPVVFNATATFNGAVVGISSATVPVVNTSTLNVASAVVWPDAYAQKASAGVVHLEDFGGIADGLTNNTTAFAAAIAFATTTFRDAMIELRGGVYGIMDQVIVPQHLTIAGAGMGATTIQALPGFASGHDILHCGPNAGANYTSDGYSFGKYITIRDLAIDGTNGSNFSYGIAAQGVHYFKAERVFISSTSKYGIDVEGSTGTFVESPIITQCHFYNCGRTGGADTIGGGYTNGSQYTFNVMEKCNGTAIDNVSAKNALWEGNRTFDPVSFGGCGIWSDFGFEGGVIRDNVISSGSIHVYGYLGPTLLGSPKNVLIEGNKLTYPGSSAILVTPANQSSSSSFTVVGCRIVNNRVENAYDSAISVGDAPGAVITGNQIDDWGWVTTSAPAIQIGAGLNPNVATSSATIAGNYGRQGPSSSWYEESASAGQIFNNQIYGNEFNGCTYMLATTSSTLASFPVGYQTFYGPGSNNSKIGGFKFTTDRFGLRYALIRGMQGSDAANIGIDFWTMFGDGNGITRKLFLNPDGSLTQTAQGGRNAFSQGTDFAGGNTYSSYENHAGSQTFTGSAVSVSAPLAVSGGAVMSSYVNHAGSTTFSSTMSISGGAANVDSSTWTKSGTNTFTQNVVLGADIYKTALTDYSGSSSITGWSSFTTKTMQYKQIGKTTYFYFDLRGTSDSTSISFTLPSTISSAITLTVQACGALDNGISPTAPASMSAAGGTNSVTVYKDNAGTAWTGSGTKNIYGVFIYESQ